MRLPSPALVVACAALLLATGGVAYGTVATTSGKGPEPPSNPFSFPSVSFTDGAFTAQMPATTATLAFTGFSIANVTSAGMAVTLYEYGETGTSCVPTGTYKFLGQWAVPTGQTLEQQLTTPWVLKPLPGASYWCLGTYVNGNGGQSFYTGYNGYVVKGAFPMANAAPVPGGPMPSR